MVAFCLRLANLSRVTSRLLARSTVSRSTSRPSRSSNVSEATAGCCRCSSNALAMPTRPRAMSRSCVGCGSRGSQHQGGARSRQGAVRQTRDRRLDRVATRPLPGRRLDALGSIALHEAEDAEAGSRPCSGCGCSASTRHIGSVYTGHRRVPAPVRRASVARDGRAPIDRHGMPCVRARRRAGERGHGIALPQPARTDQRLRGLAPPLTSTTPSWVGIVGI